MADKKLLEESVIARFQQLANINGGSKTVLSESGVRTPIPMRTEQGGFKGRDQAGRTMMGEEKEAEEAYPEESPEEAEGDDMDAMTGAAEGGDDDVKAAFGELVQAFNVFAGKVKGLEDVEVAAEPEGSEGEGESEEAPEMGMGGEDMSDEEEMSAPEEDEPLAESIELVDESLVEKLLQRVSARLVAEARKSRELQEAKGGVWTQGPRKASTNKAKTKGKGPGKGTPFNHPAKGVKGAAGRGR